MGKANEGETGPAELTDAVVRSSANEADQGVEPARMRPRRGRGRPSIGAQAATLFPVRLEPELRETLTRAANGRTQSTSELARRVLRHYLRSIWPSSVQQAGADSSGTQPEEESARTRNIENLILELETRWEDPAVEFKEALTVRSQRDKSEFVKDVLGLVTTQGSARRFLMIGWSDKTHKVQPPGVDPALSEDQLQQILNSHCEPPPHIAYFTHVWEGVRVGVIEIIRESIKQPHQVSVDFGRRAKGEVFVRHGAITEPPTPRELDALHQEAINAKLREAADPLIRPDQATLRFTGLGLSMGGLISPEAAVRLQKHNVDFELADAVPDDTRKLFERLQAIHMQGIWEYQMFTVANDYALQVLEHALWQRLLHHYSLKPPLFDVRGKPLRAEHTTMTEIANVVGLGRHRLGSSRAPGTLLKFSGTLSDLLAWARHEGLLRGQRSRRFDIVFPRMLARLRPMTYSLHMPVDSSRLIREVGEFINQVWGTATRDGRVFPEPLVRRPVVLGWPPERNQIVQFQPANLSEERDRRDWQFVVLLAVESDDELFEFHSDIESTMFPTRLLSGPLGWQDTIDWLEVHKPDPDRVEVLDRWFVARLGSHDWARNPGQFAGLPPSDRQGAWMLIQADVPADAIVHARTVSNVTERHRRIGTCDQCWVTAKASGSWRRVLGAATRLGLDMTPLPPVRVVTPLRSGWQVTGSADMVEAE